ncbi:MAG: hypothetical protein IT551_10455 [Novosphingobium sp.]|nr:hypothetical protein [Novosphingobium sp.]
MSHTPFWKIRREVARAAGHLLRAPVVIPQNLLSTVYNDWILARHMHVTSGDLQITNNIAVYLIFPKAGLLPTHLQALSYLSENGYAPIVVSNLPLSVEDRQILRKASAVLIERKNFGYDFGGYRAAIMWLESRRPNIKRLFLFNDSTWFPLPTGRNWLKEVEALGVDFSAATWTGAVNRPAPWDYEAMDWAIDKGRRNFHYASYALAFSERILADPEFWSFWRRLKLTTAKNRTVRRGEIGLTRWVIRHGYSHGATDELSDLGQRLAALSDVQLDQLLQHLIILDDHEMDDCLARLLETRSVAPDFRKRAEKLILTVTARRGAAYALAEPMIREDRFPFLKKSPSKADVAPAAVVRDILDHLGGDFSREIREEIARK